MSGLLELVVNVLSFVLWTENQFSFDSVDEPTVRMVSDLNFQLPHPEIFRDLRFKLKSEG